MGWCGVIWEGWLEGGEDGAGWMEVSTRSQGVRGNESEVEEGIKQVLKGFAQDCWGERMRLCVFCAECKSACGKG